MFDDKHTMMVNFLYQLDWAMGHPDIWLNILSKHVCEDVSTRHEHLHW